MIVILDRKGRNTDFVCEANIITRVLYRTSIEQEPYSTTKVNYGKFLNVKIVLKAAIAF